MRFWLYEFAGKETYLRQALYAAGHTQAERVDETDLLLVDTDAAWAQPRPDMIQMAKQAGAKVALYPHGGQPCCWMYDGIAEPNPDVDLRLEHGPGSLEIADLLGLDLRQQAPGWLYSPTQPFAPVSEPRKVLFAPLHPIIETIADEMNGHDPAAAWNQRIYRELLALGYDLTVSVVGPAYRSGIWPHPRATLVGNPRMLFTHTYEQIQAADVVVAAGTAAAAAVACGKPTVMFGQENFKDYVDGKYPYATNPHLYRHLVRYPLDADDGDLDELIGRACAGDTGAAVWRARFIGDDGVAEAVRILENLVHTPPTAALKLSTETNRRVVVEGVTATAHGQGG